MYLSKLFFYPKKDISSEAEITSHKLMLKANLIDQSASGLYSFLPIGLRVLKKIENIIREEHNKAGLAEILTPTLQLSELWKKSGRGEYAGKETLRLQDRHNREMFLSPTAEEVMVDIFKKYVRSYKDLPINIYQIATKFRDEIRPRFGIMRAREFLMKDAYSFDLNEIEAKKTYKKYFELYLKIFARIGVVAIPAAADNGEIGGDLSHEFNILADVGENEIYVEEDFIKEVKSGETNFDKLTKYYVRTQERHNEEEIKGKIIIKKRAIEVGHIFNFGDFYAKPLNAVVTDRDGKEKYVNMGSYGIGVSRLIPAIIESSHDEKGIIWPDSVAPFQVIIIPLSKRNEELLQKAEEIYQALIARNIEVLFDDRDKSAGVKFSDADLIGIKKQIILGEKSFKEGKVEIKNRQTEARDLISFEQAKNLEL